MHSRRGTVEEGLFIHTGARATRRREGVPDPRRLEAAGGRRYLVPGCQVRCSARVGTGFRSEHAETNLLRLKAEAAVALALDFALWYVFGVLLRIMRTVLLDQNWLAEPLLPACALDSADGCVSACSDAGLCSLCCLCRFQCLAVAMIPVMINTGSSLVSELAKEDYQSADKDMIGLHTRAWRISCLLCCSVRHLRGLVGCVPRDCVLAWRCKSPVRSCF